MANRHFRGDEEPSRGMFGYEGEGYLRRGGDNEDIRTGFSGSYGGGPRGGWNIGYGSDRPSYRGRGPKNYTRSDERIREDVCERLAMDHDVDASDIEVAVTDCVVTLTGTVHGRHEKRLAEDLSESVRGVKDVLNNLRVAR